MEEIRKEERKIVRRMLGSEMKDGKVRLRTNKVLNQRTDGVVEKMRKRRIYFYVHSLRMDRNRLTKIIFDFFRRR